MGLDKESKRMACCALVLRYLQNGEQCSTEMSRRMVKDRIKPYLVMTPREITVLIRGYLRGYVVTRRYGGRTYFSLREGLKTREKLTVNGHAFSG